MYLEDLFLSFMSKCILQGIKRQYRRSLFITPIKKKILEKLKNRIKNKEIAGVGFEPTTSRL